MPQQLDSPSANPDEYAANSIAHHTVTQSGASLFREPCRFSNQESAEGTLDDMGLPNLRDCSKTSKQEAFSREESEEHQADAKQQAMLEAGNEADRSEYEQEHGDIGDNLVHLSETFLPTILSLPDSHDATSSAQKNQFPMQSHSHRSSVSADTEHASIPYSPGSEDGTPLKQNIALIEIQPIDTPFADALKHFKNIKGNRSASRKHNFPGKLRRNACLPAEIAQVVQAAKAAEDDLEKLARRAMETNNCEENKDLQDLERYRQYDLAPLDTVLDTQAAGDIIMLGSPSSTFSKMSKGNVEQPKSTTAGALASPTTNPVELITPPKRASADDSSIPGSSGSSCILKVESDASEVQLTNYIRECGTKLNADQVDMDNPAATIFDNPDSYVVGTNDAGISGEHPVFIQVIGLVPMALMTTLVAKMTSIANWSIDTILSKLAGLDWDEKDGERD
ncbi:hypothetical protein BU24DRAFT_467335 [Aaosphaeria arxii CBS 175.79]|uniref:Uncharacterized protein n=1 Tax=Aaosphaeria arxii CBS 175.79 TaxID=1450172 RepID=A0A6A5XA45_9PLEO|nr:uncharacterized protein BU24DRAFT_467335 [Aaosphaeria arxii CBS 175.79]KAF2009822.1 hypothetical protein BU24DRAFT_467335 [Aaosphaeria arxii CBS 175.79]